MGTKVEIASAILRNDCIQAAIAMVLKHKKNIAALVTKVQKIVLYIKVPQKCTCSCSSELNPLVNMPYNNAAPPMPIKA